MRRLLRRAALGVQGQAPGLIGQPSVQPRDPGDVARLLARLGDAAAGHLLDLVRRQPAPLHQSGLRGAEDLGRVQPGQHPAALADRRPHRLDDHRRAHRALRSGRSGAATVLERVPILARAAIH
jgi:hypothetical protein